jgi:hypothetical protein
MIAKYIPRELWKTRLYLCLLLNFNFPLLEDKVRSHDALPNVLDILHHSLEMRGGIVGASDEDIIISTRRRWRVERRDGEESKTTLALALDTKQRH